MSTTTLSPIRRATSRAGIALGAVAAAALVVAGVWNVLVQEHVTVDDPPERVPTATVDQAMHQYYGWYAGTVGQERAVTIFGIAGMVGLIVLAGSLRRRLADADLLSHAACTGLGAGGVLWIVGELILIGGHRAVGLMATHGNPIDGVNSIAFTVDMTEQAFAAAGFVVLGLAMVAIGIAPVRLAGPRWAALVILDGLLSLLVAIGYLRGVDFLQTYVLGLLAAVLVPAWLVWTGRLLDRAGTPSS